MSIRNRKMNPIRFRDLSEEPDFITKWPNQYNAKLRVRNYAGINPISWYKEWVINRTISLQFRIISELTDPNITIYKFNQSTLSYEAYGSITPVDITPSGFVSEDVFKYDFTPSQEGLYYLDFSEPGFVSDEFIVFSSEKYTKKVVEISYFNSENRLGMVFFDEQDPKYSGLQYYTANIIEADENNTIDGYESDLGNYILQRATPVQTAQLVISDIHRYYIPQLGLMMSVDNVTINGIRYDRDGAMQKTQKESSDIYDIVFNLRETNTEY